MKPPSQLPIVSYFKRYWLLLILFGLFLAVSLNDLLFKVAGTLIYGPTLILGAMIVALLIRNIFNADTTDADADSGYTAREWKNQSAEFRLRWAKIEILVYFLGGCIVLSALIR